MKSEAALKSYLDKQVESGVITPVERNALGRQRSKVIPISQQKPKKENN